LATSVGCPIILLDQQRPKVVADEWSPFRVNHVRVESTTSIVADIQIIDVIHATQMLMQANKS
jgi:hypothetical protein